jgi:putative alpha-1,2-mannosidase
MKARSISGDWAEGGYCEGTEWTYSWYVPHDVQGLINLMGGGQRFCAKLRACFKDGHYVHDNEPPLHYAYLFNYAGQAWQTQQWSRSIMNTSYRATPGGIPGNDDLGALSSWYVLSAMGVYPVTPGTPVYQIGSPLFDEALLHGPGGKTFSIRAKNNSAANIYIQSATLDGKPLDRSWITHEEIVSGKTLELQMGPKPNKAWPGKSQQLPPSMTEGRPAFTITQRQPSELTMAAGDSFNLSFTIANAGRANGTAEITITDNGRPLKKLYKVVKADTSIN